MKLQESLSYNIFHIQASTKIDTILFLLMVYKYLNLGGLKD